MIHEYQLDLWVGGSKDCDSLQVTPTVEVFNRRHLRGVPLITSDHEGVSREVRDLDYHQVGLADVAGANVAVWVHACFTGDLEGEVKRRVPQFSKWVVPPQ